MILFQHWELQSTEGKIYWSALGLRHPEVMGKKVRFGKPKLRNNLVFFAFSLANKTLTDLLEKIPCDDSTHTRENWNLWNSKN